jgi:hypothetical protein
METVKVKLYLCLTKHRAMKLYWRVVFKNGLRGCGLDSSGSGQGPVTGCCEHDYGLSGSIKGREFLD